VSYLLNIDTAIEGASICLSEGEAIIAGSANSVQKDSAAWLHLAIQRLMNEQQISLTQLSAIAVSSGPGSYTGLRVGMSTAKGLCYALHLPLITINTLEMMAEAARDKTVELLCPMIDARRMEVFTAVYDHSLKEVLPPTNKILDENSFSVILDQHRLAFFGNGSSKFKQLINNHRNASFIDVTYTACDMRRIAASKFSGKEFSDLAYAEPFYGKQFYSPPAKKKI
jgi:tRNA threonylcarbamoyladenosine biosynthesis protein TsaB